MSVENPAKVPEWIKAPLFEPVFREKEKHFRTIKTFAAEAALNPGENYATIMLRINAELELTDGTAKHCSLMIKTVPPSELFEEMLKERNIFDLERCMYSEVVPEMEAIYAEVGLNVKFGAKSYHLNTGEHYVLLEDLKSSGFKNINRLEGLDLEHAQCALKKLAQWHAASAMRVATKGPYPEKFTTGLYTPKNKDQFKEVFSGMVKFFIEAARHCENSEEYFEQLNEASRNLFDHFDMIEIRQLDGFQVLNHGDFWCNNIMFKHDSNGKVLETYLVDFQLPKYGTPAQDLQYLILSSTSLDIKLNKFDYLIKYYHDQLKEHLLLLAYPGEIPTLRDIHKWLLDFSDWALMTCSGVMAAVLAEPSKHANLDNFVSNSEAGIEFKKLMYRNKRYMSHLQAILPWLYYRGAF